VAAIEGFGATPSSIRPVDGMATGSVSVPGPSMTFLSRLLMSSKSARWRVRALVRSSHFVAAVVASAFAPSCLFPEPPHWDSKPTRPQLVDPIPLTSQFVVISTDPSNNGQTFRVTELSEDEGHALRVVWYLNYKLSNERYLNSRDIAAGSQCAYLLRSS